VDCLLEHQVSDLDSVLDFTRLFTDLGNINLKTEKVERIGMEKFFGLKIRNSIFLCRGVACNALTELSYVGIGLYG
jgi:hypothetical protein